MFVNNWVNLQIQSNDLIASNSKNEINHNNHDSCKNINPQINYYKAIIKMSRLVCETKIFHVSSINNCNGLI